MQVAGDLLRALAHIHVAGVTHRDVKPGNVLFDGSGRACLTDFGVARPQDATAITQTGQIPGTAPFMAPELWRGEAANERTDLFALGVLLARCLDDAVPASLIGLTERLSAENPDLRPASAEAALDLLEPESLPTSDPPMPPAEAKPGPGGISRWVPVAALCLVALIVGFALAAAGSGVTRRARPSSRRRRPNATRRLRTADLASRAGPAQDSQSSDQPAGPKRAGGRPGHPEQRGLQPGQPGELRGGDPDPSAGGRRLRERGPNR